MICATEIDFSDTNAKIVFTPGLLPQLKDNFRIQDVVAQKTSLRRSACVQVKFVETLTDLGT